MALLQMISVVKKSPLPLVQRTTNTWGRINNALVNNKKEVGPPRLQHIP